MGRPLRRARAEPSARFGCHAGRGAQELIFREGVAGRNGPHGWEAEDAGKSALQRGKGGAILPAKGTLHRIIRGRPDAGGTFYVLAFATGGIGRKGLT